MADEGSELAFLESPEVRTSLIARLADSPTNVRQEAEEAFERATESLRSGNDEEAVAAVSAFKDAAGSIWLECEKECKHLQEQGNAAAYAQCYLMCVARKSTGG